MVRKEVRRRDGGVIQSVHVRYDEVYCLYTMGVVVDKLAELRGEEENVVRFVTVEITKKEELSLWVLHLEEVKVHGNVVS